jgi:hypothetical protein
MFTFLTRLFKQPSGYKIQLTHGFFARRLANGKWVLERTGKSGKAVDLVSNELFYWEYGNQFYKDCLADSYEEVERKFLDILAKHGI